MRRSVLNRFYAALTDPPARVRAGAVSVGVTGRPAPRGAWRAVCVWVTVCSATAAAQPGGPGGAVRVVVAPAVEREVFSQKKFVANVQPRRVSVVGSAVDGRVLEASFDEGDAVVAGQPLVKLRTRTIETELAAARAELALRRHELAELENGSRPEEIAQAKAAMLAHQARMEYAKKDLARIQRLYEAASAADDELDEAISLATATEQEYLEAKAAYALAVAGPREERIHRARAHMERQQHEVERLEDILSKYTMIVPFDGFVTAKQTEVGEWVDKGRAVAEIIELKVVDVEAMVSEDYIHGVTLGMAAGVVTPSLPEGKFEGKVALIVPQADARSRTFRVKVRTSNPLENGRPVLKAGMFAEVLLGVGQPRRALLVPKDAIVLGGPTPAVYVLEPDSGEPASEAQAAGGRPEPDPTRVGGLEGTARAVPVSLGVSDGAMVEVRGIEPGDSEAAGPHARLAAGDLVVVRGNERLVPGQRIQASEETAAAAGTGEVR